MTLPFPFPDSLLMFYIYGFVGWIVEVIYYGVTEGKFINRGFLNGPLCPVYGIGFYGVIWFFLPVAHDFPVLFFGSAFIATTVELIAGVILYHTFHLRWWDYSEYKYNLHGYICIRFAIYWGIACSLGMYLLHPAVMGFINHLPKPVEMSLLFLFTAIMAVDLIVTVISIFGFNQKIEFIQSVSGGIRKYSDKIGSQIYDTVDTIVTKTTPAVETTTQTYSEFRELYAKHRQEEKELAQKNRAEERKLLMEYVGTGKEAFINTKDAAGRKVKATWGKIRHSEVRLIRVIRTNKRDDNEEVIRYMKDNYDDKHSKDRMMEEDPV